MKIRAKTLEGWLKHHFNRNQLQDIAQYGANAGWHGLCYTSDISRLYTKFKEDIWQHVCAESDSIGYSNPFELIAALNGAKNVSCVTDMEALMVYYAVESIAYHISENLH